MSARPCRSLVVAAALFAAGAASAQTPPAPKVRQACMADLQRLCPDAVPGHGAILQCFRGRAAELSPDCRSALMARRAANQARRAADAQSPAPVAPQ